MKKSATMLLLVVLLAVVPSWAKVFTRLEMVSNSNGVLVVDVQSYSNFGEPLIKMYQGSFKISQTLEKRVKAVEFSHLLFERPAYIQKYGYSTTYHKVTWTYTFDPNAGFPYAAIPGTWTTALRVTIYYTVGDEKATLSWAGSPIYTVLDADGRNIAGDYYPVPPALADVPLPVQLTSFNTQPLEQGGIELTWRTESEFNNLGFNVYRSFSEEEGYERINEELIMGQGTSSAPHDYFFIDRSPEAQVGCWYLVESLSLEGLSTFEGPVQAAVRSGVCKEKPSEWVLLQNYPNPFNPSTEIRFSVEQPSQVELNIYSIRGTLVKRLFSGNMTAGVHQVTWDGLDDRGIRVESGIYLCELRLTDQVVYRKITLMK